MRALIVALAATVPAARAQSGFPFGHELLLDAAPLQGSKRVPSLDIGPDGIAMMDLWCNSMRTQLVVVADTITVIPGERTSRECPADRARADDDLVGALAQVGTWQFDGDVLVLLGGPAPLRFRMQTN